MSLPEQFPIFPLPNVVLFPDVQLPLHIFEPRYRAMTEAALAGDRTIGMVLLRPGADAALREAPVFDVGCCGPIEESRRLPDGRFSLTLRGERRFRIAHELDGPPYRVATAEYLPDIPFDALGRADQRSLREGCDRIAELLTPQSEDSGDSQPTPLARVRELLSDVDAVAFVHAVSFGLNCTMVEKQGLLEASDPLERCRTLIALLEFRVAERGAPGRPGRLN